MTPEARISERIGLLIQTLC